MALIPYVKAVESGSSFEWNGLRTMMSLSFPFHGPHGPHVVKEGFRCFVSSVCTIDIVLRPPRRYYCQGTTATHHRLFQRHWNIRSPQHNRRTFSTMASSVDAILAGKYPAKAHARRVVDYIKKSKSDVPSVLYLEGQKTRMIEDNDESAPFR